MQLTSARVEEVRRIVLGHIDALLPEQERAHQQASRDMLALNRQSDRLLQAFYADAIQLEQLNKQEQARIASAKAVAEAEMNRHMASRGVLLEKVTYLCTLLADAQAYYANATPTVRRQLNLSTFERIYVFDVEIVGSDMTLPLQRILSESLDSDLESERKRVGSAWGRSACRTSYPWTVPQPTRVPKRRAATSCLVPVV